MTYEGFSDINELEEYIAKHNHILYHAPLDVKPVQVEIVKYTITKRTFEGCKATLYTPQTGQFTVYLTAHFDRFKR